MFIIPSLLSLFLSPSSSLESLPNIRLVEEDGDPPTLEDEDAVAMGTVHPSVTQRLHGW